MRIAIWAAVFGLAGFIAARPALGFIPNETTRIVAGRTVTTLRLQSGYDGAAAAVGVLFAVVGVAVGRAENQRERGRTN